MTTDRTAAPIRPAAPERPAATDRSLATLRGGAHAASLRPAARAASKSLEQGPQPRELPGTETAPAAMPLRIGAVAASARIRPAGEPADPLVTGKPIARSEAVVLGE